MKDIQGDDRTGDVHADAALYAVDALEPGERAAFELHLRGCASCREEVAAFGEVGAHLASVVAAPPPAALRENVLAAVHGTRQERRSERRAGDASGATPVSLAQRRRPRRRWLAAAAAAVLLPGAALGGWALGTQTEQREQRLVAQEQDRQTRLLSAPDVTIRQLEVDGRPATLVVSEQEDAALFVASDLAGPGEDREYQLWLVQGDTPVPDVHFGGGQVRVWLDGDVGRAGAVAMTVEPAGGSETPTPPVLATAEI
ncbi:anti-sigma factor domain-containing protein [Kocuria sp. M4R2S49]|uniref:anti-sigma factor n=1 Tax=Kocuria rhizosphaericola TaxID=3376284 RepID=UPI0037895ACB